MSDNDNNDPPGLNLEVFAIPMDLVGEAVAIWGSIQMLTEDEGNSVHVLGGNPDWNGQPAWAIECCGEWTEWQDRRFAHDERVGCFSEALDAYLKWKQQP